jgi:hypothetical protein
VTVDYEGGWYEEPDEAPECPNVWHVLWETPTYECPTCGDEA